MSKFVPRIDPRRIVSPRRVSPIDVVVIVVTVVRPSVFMSLPSSESGNHIAHYRLASNDNHILTSIAHILRWRRGRLLLHHWCRSEIVPYENIVASIQFD
ncbi:hypothetical protein ACFE04_019461 [Oxalis oulophora]